MAQSDTCCLTLAHTGSHSENTKRAGTDCRTPLEIISFSTMPHHLSHNNRLTVIWLGRWGVFAVSGRDDVDVGSDDRVLKFKKNLNM